MSSGEFRQSLRRYPELRPLLICDDSGLATAERAGVQAMTWQDFLLSGPPDVPEA